MATETKEKDAEFEITPERLDAVFRGETGRDRGLSPLAAARRDESIRLIMDAGRLCGKTISRLKAAKFDGVADFGAEVQSIVDKCRLMQMRIERGVDPDDLAAEIGSLCAGTAQEIRLAQSVLNEHFRRIDGFLKLVSDKCELAGAEAEKAFFFPIDTEEE